MGEEPRDETSREQKTVSGQRVLLYLLGLTVVMGLLLLLFMLDVRNRKPDVIVPINLPATQPAVSNDPG